MSSVKIEIESEAIASLISDLHLLAAGEWMINAQGEASEDVYNFFQKWYRAGGRERFVNPQLSTHGAGRATTRWFEQSVLQSWEPRNARESGFDFVNDNASFALKVTGGTISAKNASALTIPLTPEAHAKRVAQYSETVGKLFRPKNKNYLARVVEGGIEPVYLLRKSVSIKPNPSLIPTEEEVAAPYESALYEALMREANSLFNTPE